jgi:hypothetical protein
MTERRAKAELTYQARRLPCILAAYEHELLWRSLRSIRGDSDV